VRTTAEPSAPLTGDGGDDAFRIRQWLQQYEIRSVISSRRRCLMLKAGCSVGYDAQAYRARNVIERHSLNHFMVRSMTLRFEKLILNYHGFVHLA
jgi:hypothetical protein